MDALAEDVREVIMKCHRCHGWMVMERYYGPGMPYWAMRCMLCGEILDPLILENRNLRRKRAPLRNQES